MAEKRKGDLQKVGDLFAIHKKRLKAPQATVITETRDLIRDMFGYDVPKEQITYTPSSRTLAVNTNSQLKTEIRLRKDEVLAHLTARLGERSAPKEIL